MAVAHHYTGTPYPDRSLETCPYQQSAPDNCAGSLPVVGMPVRMEMTELATGTAARQEDGVPSGPGRTASPGMPAGPAAPVAAEVVVGVRFPLFFNSAKLSMPAFYMR